MNNEHKNEINIVEFWDLFGKLNQLIGMLLVAAHGDDRKTYAAGSSASAFLLSHLIRIVVPDATKDELSYAMYKTRDEFEAFKKTAEEAKNIINNSRSSPNDRN